MAKIRRSISASSIGSIQAFLRRRAVTVVCCATGSFFALRPPNTGKSNDGWRRSGSALVRFPLFAIPFPAGASCARLRFKAAIKSITGGGAVTARGLIGNPFILASISSRNACW
jgi:hypothetical protein